MTTPAAALDGLSPVRRAPVLGATGLVAGYGGVPVVRDVDLEVNAGEVVALFGANGAGKTTTLLSLVGALPRWAGDVRWQGDTTTDPLHRLARRGLAFVPEERSVIAGLSTLDNLRIGQGPVETALELVPELEPLLDRRAGLLSGGQQQMLALARVLAARPTALVIDELSLGLAPLVVDRLLGVLREAADTRGIGVLVVEQQAERALSVVDRWYLLTNGRITAQGSRADGPAALREAFVAGLRGQTPVEGTP